MIKFENISKTYRTKHGDVKSLDNINLEINEGEFIVIRGPSGCGKTTLLLTLGGMLHPTNGKVSIDGKDIYSMSPRAIAQFRKQNIGFVFQMFYLIPYLSTIDNVNLAFGTSGKQKNQNKVEDFLNRLHLSDRVQHKPSQLSTGERQRTAIARALINNPKIILADEPTGNLDPENAAESIGYLADFHKSGGTVIVVTHGEVADEYANRIIYLRNGRLDNTQS